MFSLIDVLSFQINVLTFKCVTLLSLVRSPAFTLVAAVRIVTTASGAGIVAWISVTRPNVTIDATEARIAAAYA